MGPYFAIVTYLNGWVPYFLLMFILLHINASTTAGSLHHKHEASSPKRQRSCCFPFQRLAPFEKAPICNFLQYTRRSFTPSARKDGGGVLGMGADHFSCELEGKWWAQIWSTSSVITSAVTGSIIKPSSQYLVLSKISDWMGECSFCFPNM